MTYVFFVGIFGVQFKAKSLIVEQGVICPCCGAYDRYEVLKTFNYFHIFFIPVWRWNKHYYIRTRCCSQTSELRQDVGERIERGGRGCRLQTSTLSTPSQPGAIVQTAERAWNGRLTSVPTAALNWNEQGKKGCWFFASSPLPIV
ncbi:MAG: zinc ribbon domain-containing protein [Limnochordia bacterium]